MLHRNTTEDNENTVLNNNCTVHYLLQQDTVIFIDLQKLIYLTSLSMSIKKTADYSD